MVRRLSQVLRNFLQLIVAVCTSTRPVSAAEFLVRPDGSGDAPTIQAAVDLSTDGDIITLADGRFVGDGNRDIIVRKAVTIRSQGGDPESCIIDCTDPSGSFHDGIYFRFTASNPTLEGITITGGRLDEFDTGAAVKMWFSSPTLRRCVFRNNVAGQGAAIHVQSASPTLEECIIVQNTATRFGGGGIYCGEASPTIVSCTIADNTAVKGAGIACWMSTPTIGHTIISGNDGGEAVYCAESSAAIVSCSDIFDNSGGDWVGCIEDQAAVNGNFAAAPLFCDAANGNFALCPQSPCAPPGVTGCGLVGALGVGCETVGRDPSSWAETKARYR
jgi:predicted outer membrane repeat protein